MLLVTTDPSGATQSAVSQQLNVAAATADVTGAIVKAPGTAKAGRKVPLTFTIANSTAANVAASGAVQIRFEAFPDGLPSDASVVDSVTKRVNLKPGKSMTFTVSLPFSATSFVIVDVDPNNAAFPNDTNPANNVFATSQAVVVS